MATFKLTLAYDGTAFAGWQRQPGRRTVQGEVEAALARLDGQPVAVTDAGRTDAGVHATGQVASVRLLTPREPDTVMRALNAALPVDVRVCGVAAASDGFDARREARGKTYCYWIWNGPSVPPLMRHLLWHVPCPLDEDAMDAAARAFEGTHDFASLQAAGAAVKTTVRTIHRARVVRRIPGDGPGVPADAPAALVQLTVSGTGFLRHMVRTLAGTLVEVGHGWRRAADMPALLDARQRAAAGRTAPAMGLCLRAVDYDNPM